MRTEKHGYWLPACVGIGKFSISNVVGEDFAAALVVKRLCVGCFKITVLQSTFYRCSVLVPDKFLPTTVSLFWSRYKHMNDMFLMLHGIALVWTHGFSLSRVDRGAL